MKKLKKENRIFILTFFVGGLVYASFMAGYDHFQGESFDQIRFIGNSLFFGIVMGLLNRYQYLRSLKKKTK